MRKLPVYIIVDSSFSMRGEPMHQINNGFKELINRLKKDPLLIEVLSLSIIEFNTLAHQALPLTPIWQAKIQNIEAKGKSNMGAAFKLLNSCMQSEINNGDIEKELKGDYKPIIYLLTDGAPSDAWKNHLKELKKNFNPRIISFGTHNAKFEVLNRISHKQDVIDLNQFESGLTSFFELVSQSLQVYSVANSMDPDLISEDELPIVSYELNEEILF